MRSTSPSLAGRQANTVQYDGFEYNSVFRQKGWKAETGNLGAGGYVRRRRWVRLMVREARTVPVMDQTTDGVGTNAPSIITQPRATSSVFDDDTMAAMWDGTVGDFRRCARAMNMAGRDGTKIELWARWLQLEPRSTADQYKRKWTEDEAQRSGSLTPQSSSRIVPSPTHSSPSASAIMLAMNAPSREHLSSLLRNHVRTLSSLEHPHSTFVVLRAPTSSNYSSTPILAPNSWTSSKTPVFPPPSTPRRSQSCNSGATSEDCPP